MRKPPTGVLQQAADRPGGSFFPVAGDPEVAGSSVFRGPRPSQTPGLQATPASITKTADFRSRSSAYSRSGVRSAAPFAVQGRGLPGRRSFLDVDYHKTSRFRAAELVGRPDRPPKRCHTLLGRVPPRSTPPPPRSSPWPAESVDSTNESLVNERAAAFQCSSVPTCWSGLLAVAGAG